MSELLNPSTNTVKEKKGGKWACEQINLINSSSLTNGMEKPEWKNKKIAKQDISWGKRMDVNSRCRVTGQRGRADCGMGLLMKKSGKWKHLRNSLFFCEFRIKSSQRERFSTVIRGEIKKTASAKGGGRGGGLPVYIQEWSLSLYTTQRLSIWDFILIFSERLCRCNYSLSENSSFQPQEGNFGWVWELEGEHSNIWVCFFFLFFFFNLFRPR